MDGSRVCCAGFYLDPGVNQCVKCPVGSHGMHCLEKCKYPTFGEDCQMKCWCEMGWCDPERGCPSTYAPNRVEEITVKLHLTDSVQKAYLVTETPSHIDNQSVTEWKSLPTTEVFTESLKNQEQSKDILTVLMNSKWWIVIAAVLFILISTVTAIYITKRKQRIIAIKRLSDYQTVQHVADYDQLQTDRALPVRVEFREEARYSDVDDIHFSHEILSNLPSQDETRDLDMIDGQILQTLHGIELPRDIEELYIQVLPSDDYLEPNSSKLEVQTHDSEDYIQIMSTKETEDEKCLPDRDSECSLDLK